MLRTARLIVAGLVLPAILAACAGSPASSGSSGTPPLHSQTATPAGESPIVSASAALAGPTEGRIAFLRWADMNGSQTDVFAVDPDGGELAQLTDDAKKELFLYWLEDGSRLVFVWSDAIDPNDGEGHLASVLPDGSDRKELGTVQWMPSQPAVSADGRWVAFSGDGDPAGGSGVVLLDLVHGTRTVLTTDGGHSARWSPDGTRLLVGLSGRVAVLDATGGERLATIVDPGFETTVGWTPDGASILYHSCPAGMNKPECMAQPLVIADADGSNARSFEGDSPIEGVLSPDGAWLAVNRENRIQVVSTKGLAGGPLGIAADDLAWSPDAEWLVYAVGGPGEDATFEQLWVVSRHGGVPLPLTMGPRDYAPAWGPG